MNSKYTQVTSVVGRLVSLLIKPTDTSAYHVSYLALATSDLFKLLKTFFGFKNFYSFFWNIM